MMAEQVTRTMSTSLHEDTNTGVAILSRILEPDEVVLTPEAARTLLSLRFPKTDERRMNRLASKARHGTLTEKERFETQQYNLVSHLLAFLQARARHALGNEEQGL
jgi:hypothetical protein